MKTTISSNFDDSIKEMLVYVFENEKLNKVIEKNIFLNFSGKFLETMTFPLESGVKIVAVGLGDYNEFNLHKLRQASAKGYLASPKKSENKTLMAVFDFIDGFCKNETIEAILLGMGMSAYKYDKYISEKKENEIENIVFLTTENENNLKSGIKKAEVLNSAMDYTKDMVFEPAQNMTPDKVSKMAFMLSEQYGIDCKIYNKEELKKMNFNAFLAVGQGSVQEPKFIHLTYKSDNPKKKIALIGKGITFDSGGLDIKPPQSMLTMKTDMTGCATVLGVMKAICELKPDIELHCLSALCENMPSGSSYKVGDILITKSGKTIEVDNTDAEGRLTLADALTYADDIGADEVIDIATLTGAVIVALGNNITGIMGNNQEQINSFKETADKTGENVWQLPIYDDMMENLKSDIADMKNTGPRYAGSSVAGRFLQNYTKSKKWLHIDIAGTAYTDKPYKEIPKGATGVMLRSLVNYLIK